MRNSDKQQDEFAGKAVAIVGGHLGVGPAVVRAFAERDARVVVGELRHVPVSDAQRDACALPGVSTVPVEWTDVPSINRFYDEVERRIGGLDVVVMVAPPVTTAGALDIPAERYRRVIDDELTSPVLTILEAARRMVPRGRGRIISFCSMSGKTGTHKHVAPFAAAKGGLIAFSRALATDLAPTGVTVNAIATALFDVQVAALADKSEVEKGIPVGRVGRSEEAAHAVLYLASERAGYVTGETLNLSGGRFMD